MGLQTFVFQRTLKALLTVFAILVFVFVGARLTGDPFSTMYPEGLTNEELLLLNHKYGLDQPIMFQFQRYLHNVMQGDFGMSIHEALPVTEIFARAATETLKLGTFAYLFSIGIGVTMGILSSLKPRSLLARSLMFVSGIGYSIPSFIIAISLILLFSFHLQLLPSMGMGSPASYIMPIIALSIHPIASIARYVRSSFMDVLLQDYVRTARAKGLGERLVILKHALRNTLIPLATVMGMLVIDILGGSIVVETVFSWPGFGKQLIDSVMNKDFPVIQFGVVSFSVVVIIINLLVDILYGVIDPRIRKAD